MKGLTQEPPAVATDDVKEPLRLEGMIPELFGCASCVKKKIEKRIGRLDSAIGCSDWTSEP